MSKPRRIATAARIGLVAALALGTTTCKEETLAAEICTPGNLRCLDVGAEICNGDGTAWVPGDCPEGFKCIPDDCGDDDCFGVCKEIICEPGNKVCGADNVFIFLCDDTGTEMQSCGSCAAVDGICIDGTCISLCGVEAKSNLGCEYFATDLDNANVPCRRDVFGEVQFCDAAASAYAVVLSNPDSEKSAFVNISRGPIDGPPPGATCEEPVEDPDLVAAEIIPPKGIKVFELWDNDINGTTIDERSFRIASNLPITVYQFNPLENVDVFSNDASLLLPSNAVGREYYVMTREQTFDLLKGFVTIVGITDEPADITIDVTARTLAGRNLLTNEDIDAMNPGDSMQVTLNKFEVFNLETDAIGADLTGSRIVSTEPIMVYAGSEAANAPNTNACDTIAGVCTWDNATPCTSNANCSAFITCCADHLEQQLFPTNTWDDEYIAVRSRPRGNEMDVWRIMASRDQTTVTTEPVVATIPQLDAGEWFEFQSNDDFVVRADQPVLVGQFLAAEHAPTPGVQEGDADTGDPAFILIAPRRQFRSEYVFLAPDKYAEDYVSIAAPKGAVVLLDGEPIQSVNLVQSSDIQAVIDGGTYTAYRAPIADGFHKLDCTEPCSVMVHGYDSFVSYGYPGGLNLEDDE